MSTRHGRPRHGRPVLTLMLAGLASACSFGEPAQASQADTRSSLADAQDSRWAESDPPPNTEYARSLSAAFRSASSAALPGVVYVSVERDAQMAVESPGPELFRRFFGTPSPQQPLPPQVGSGTGFAIDESGHIVTNHHVVAGATRVEVRTRDGHEYEAEVVGSDASTDIALLRVEDANLPPLAIGNSDELLVGDWVLALGNPLGLEFTVTSGIVSAMGRQLTGRALAVESFIQTDAAINPGNSGGPLIDLSGRVVGVNTAIFGGDRFVGYGFAVPITLALEVVEDLREYGYARRPRLGVRVSPVTAVDAEVYGLEEVRGAEIVAIDDDSPALGKLEIGDVVLALEGHDIEDSNALVTLLARMDPGDEVELLVMRDRRETSVRVKLGEFEPSESAALSRSEEADVEELLGFRVAPLTPELARRFGHDRSSGLVVSAVRRYGSAQGAGVRAGQVLLAINGERVESVRSFERAIDSIESGDVVSLRVVDPELGETIVNYRVRSP